MKTFAQLLTFAAITTGAFAVPSSAPSSHCANGDAVATTSFTVNGVTVQRTTHSCGDRVTPRQYGYYPPSPTNVCLQSCSTSCNNITGRLPPTSGDCDAIRAAVAIFFNELNSPTFVVESMHMESLSFGTCSYFFENLSSGPIEECWEDFVSNGQAAGDACFPPHQPFFPQGLCTGAGGAWAMGATHS